MCQVLISYFIPSSLSLSVTPKQWENISDIHMAKVEQQKTNSLSLRALVESLLEQTAADMQKQLQATTEAFQHNVQEIKSAKSQMEDQLTTVEQMILCLAEREGRQSQAVGDRCHNKYEREEICLNYHISIETV